MDMHEEDVYKYVDIMRAKRATSSTTKNIAAADNTTSPPVTYNISIADKELLKTLRIMIKSINSLVSFVQEIINVLLALREQLQKQESMLSETLGEF